MKSKLPKSGPLWQPKFHILIHKKSPPQDFGQNCSLTRFDVDFLRQQHYNFINGHVHLEQRPAAAGYMQWYAKEINQNICFLQKKVLADLLDTFWAPFFDIFLDALLNALLDALLDPLLNPLLDALSDALLDVVLEALLNALLGAFWALFKTLFWTLF
jgi:hypothetical protein